MPLPALTKPCTHCGAPITRTKNNVKEWDKLIHCSNACTRIANRQRRQAGEDVGLAPPIVKNDYGARVWVEKKTKKGK